MLCLAVRVDDDLERFLTQRLAVQEGVDLGVGDAVGRFVGFARHQVFEVSSRNFLDQILWRTKAASNRTDLILHQTAQWREVAGAVAELGEEAR